MTLTNYDLGAKNIKKNLKSGFGAAGIEPLGRKLVLERIPAGNRKECENQQLGPILLKFSAGV